MSPAPTRTITAQLVRGKGILSAGIGWFGAGYYSHIDVITPAGLLRGARSDSVGGRMPGVWDRPQAYEKWTRCTRFTFDVTPIQYQLFWDFSSRQLKKPYDTHGLIDTFIFGRRWRDDDAWWCSELFAMCGEVAKRWKFPDEKKSITPGDCVDLLTGLGALIEEMPV
jgi:hypothetical protein